MEVPFLDVGATYGELRTEIDEAIALVLNSGQYLLGPQLEAFEEEFAAFVGAERAVGVGCGLDALTFALRALDLQPGDDVIVPGHTFIATWLAVTAAGGRPVPVEPEATTGNLDVAAVEAALGPATRAIVAVHLHGLPCDISGLEALARSAGVALVFDAAQAHGARWDGSGVGSFGDACAWSFYPPKNLGAFSDGGALTCADPDLADRVRRLRNYGSGRKYEHTEQGANSRLDELQAAVLRVKLRHLPEWNERRSRVAAAYGCSLERTDLLLPTVPPGRTSSWHLYAVRSEHRDQLQAHLAENDVQTVIHYPAPPHRQPAYSEYAAHPLPITDEWARTTLSLPIGPHLDPAQVDHVIESISSFRA